jgi:DNA-binding transcriptional LysR family regulator
MDRLTSLEVFGRVVDAGGFSAAARQLNMSVTMVSNHVQALEDRLGARLLNRTTRKISLTDIGRTYLERSRQILQDLEEADRLAEASQATPRGTLRLYSSDSIVRFLAPVIGDYLSLYPEVEVDLRTGEQMVDLLEEGFDVVIRGSPPPDSSLIVRRLTPWRHFLCCAPGFLKTHAAPARPADLASLNCLRYAFYPYGNDWRFAAPDGETVSVRVGGNFVTHSGETLRLLALAGHGVCLAPSFLVADDLARGRLVPLLTGYRPMEFAINAIYPHRHHLSAKVRRFIDLLAERFAAHQEWMSGGATGS